MLANQWRKIHKRERQQQFALRPMPIFLQSSKWTVDVNWTKLLKFLVSYGMCQAILGAELFHSHRVRISIPHKQAGACWVNSDSSILNTWNLVLNVNSHAGWRSIKGIAGTSAPKALFTKSLFKKRISAVNAFHLCKSRNWLLCYGDQPRHILKIFHFGIWRKYASTCTLHWGHEEGGGWRRRGKVMLCSACKAPSELPSWRQTQQTEQSL